MRPRFNAQDLLPEVGGISAALFKVTGNGSVPPITVGLIGLRACQITGNTYTLVRHANCGSLGSRKSGSTRWLPGGTHPISPKPSGPR